MNCKHPGCDGPADRMAVVNGEIGKVCVRIITGVTVCERHQPNLSAIGPNMRAGIARALEKEGATGEPTLSVDMISLDSVEAKQYFAGAPN